MSTLTAGVNDAIAGATRKADRRQADYFRGLLQKQSSQLSDNIASYYRRLTRHQVRDDFAEVRRMRRMIRGAAQEQRSLQRMIDALDDRFPELSAPQRGPEFGQEGPVRAV